MRAPNLWFALVAVSGVPTPTTLLAQPRAETTGSVLFVCEHGTVKSLLAKLMFEEYARKVGLDMAAVSRGTNADPVVPGWMTRALAADHLKLGSWQPVLLRPADLERPSYVVSFDVPASATAAARAPREQWDGLPSVSEDYGKGRDAIKVRVHRLVDSLKRAQRR
jgi:protein-tyrosine-phosphatase